MASLYHRIANGVRKMTDTQLRVIYITIALVSFTANVVTFIPIINLISFHSDDCTWLIVQHNGQKALAVALVPRGGAAEKAGVREGDIVLSINREPVPPDIYKAQDILNRAPVDEPISYQVERNGRIYDLSLTLIQRSFIIQAVIPTFALLWLIIGTIVILTQPRGPVQRHFFLTSASVVFTFSFPFFMENPAVRILWSLASIMFYPLWVHFSTKFPIRQNIFSTRLRLILLYMPFLLLVLARLSAGLIMKDHGQSSGMTFNIIGTVLYTGYFASGMWFLVRGARLLPPGANRRPMKIILIGTALAALALMYLTIIANTGAVSLFTSPQYFLPMILLLAMPISFGYVVFRYQLMDFSLVVRTAIVYAATTTMILAFYVMLSYLAGSALGSLTGEKFKWFVQTGSFVILLLALDPLRRWLQRTAENRFFPRQRDYTVQLAAYSGELAETVGKQSVAEHTARTLRTTLNLISVCVAVEDPRDHVLRKVARVSPHDPIDIEDSVMRHLGTFLVRSRGVILLETLGDPAFDELQTRYPYVAGLYAQGRVVGAVLMSRPRDGETISGSQMPFIAGVVRQAAAAIEVARLYEEEIERRRYHEELATARRIQQSLLPAVMPTFPGISISAVARPAEAVGGDYYNVLPIDGHRFIVIVADVSGKGLPASLYMAELHGMMRIAGKIHNTPKEILSTLNEHLSRTMERGTFITATVLLFDTLRRTVSYARAGHTPIIRRNGATVDSLAPVGFPLGMPSHDDSDLFNSTLQQYTVTYEPGETFILYSDGVSEAMNPHREEFGDGRLLDIVGGAQDGSAEALCANILGRVEDFRGNAEQHDDITLVVVRIEKEPAFSPNKRDLGAAPLQPVTTE